MVESRFSSGATTSAIFFAEKVEKKGNGEKSIHTAQKQTGKENENERRSPQRHSAKTKQKAGKNVISPPLIGQ